MIEGKFRKKTRSRLSVADNASLYAWVMGVHKSLYTEFIFECTMSISKCSMAFITIKFCIIIIIDNIFRIFLYLSFWIFVCSKIFYTAIKSWISDTMLDKLTHNCIWNCQLVSKSWSTDWHQLQGLFCHVTYYSILNIHYLPFVDIWILCNSIFFIQLVK